MKAASSLKGKAGTSGGGGRLAKLLNQMELQLADLVEAVTEGKVAAAIMSPVQAPEPIQKPARGRCQRTCRASASSVNGTLTLTRVDL